MDCDPGLDFFDPLTEDLELSGLSSLEEPRRTSIDQISGHDYVALRPAFRARPHGPDEMEPPIMPSEHWLEYGHRPTDKLPMHPSGFSGTAPIHQYPMHPPGFSGTAPIHQYSMHQAPLQDLRPQGLNAWPGYLQSEISAAIQSEMPMRIGDSSCKVDALAATAEFQFGEHALLCASLLLARVASGHPNGICWKAYSNFIFLLDPPDRKMAPNAYTSRVKVRDKYQIVGFISSGTYGRVYKAVGKNKSGDATSPQSTSSAAREVFAIKKFKPDKEGETVQYTGLSQSAIREMSICSELSHPNLIHLVEIILEDKCVFMVFEYCEHDLLQIIHHHTQPTRHAIPAPMIKSILFQLLNGLLYLHRSWVLHRDLKPANIMVTSNGAVRIGDLGLARLFNKPLTSLFSGDKVVVTIWYRSPDLLLGSKHYTPSIDLWAVGCIFAELLSLRPIFKGEEAKMDSKKTVPFQRNQMIKIMEVLGIPTKEDWPGIIEMPEYAQLQFLASNRSGASAYGSTSNANSRGGNPLTGTGLENWYHNVLRSNNYPSSKSPTDPATTPGASGFSLLSELLAYDPTKRLTSERALEHPYFQHPTTGKIDVSANCFEGLEEQYPHRRVSSDDNSIGIGSLPGTRRSGLPDDTLLPSAKRRA